MLKSVVVHDISIDHVAAMERWYYRDHAPEINRRFGPWLHRHDSWVPVDAPADARQFGYFNWRVTEGTWREMPAPGARGNLAFTVPPHWPRVATGFFPAQPTEDFCGAGIQPGERYVLRWYCLHRYPEGVPTDAGEKWFLETHARELAERGGPFRIFSTQAHRQPLPLPGEWPSHAHPPMSSLVLHWDRLTEFWFQDFVEWRAWMRDVVPGLTPPPWGRGGGFPYVRLGTEFVSSFLLERPTDEFARDSRGYL